MKYRPMQKGYSFGSKDEKVSKVKNQNFLNCSGVTEIRFNDPLAFIK